MPLKSILVADKRRSYGWSSWFCATTDSISCTVQFTLGVLAAPVRPTILTWQRGKQRKVDNLTGTQAAAFSSSSGRHQESWHIALVSAAHFVSHYFIMLLPPLYVFIRADYDVSYTGLGLAFVAFNVVTALLQTPAGFLVDRIGARWLLAAGLALGSASVAVAALVDSFWVFLAMFAVGGLANTVYHPADYSLLSRRISPERLGQAFAIHTFAGMLGGAAAPGSLLLIYAVAGWRGAFLAAAALGFAAAVLIALSRDLEPVRMPADKPAASEADGGWRLLLSLPILQNLLFFVLLTVASAGLQNFSIVALGELYGTSLGVANTALSGFLLLTAIGVLAGGVIAGRTTRHSLLAAFGLIGGALIAVVIGIWNLGAAFLVLMMSLAGFLQGVIMPSRDLIVRESTPPGSIGKVFGFVTSGYNIGGIIAPLVFGAMMDNASPRAVFFFVAATSVAAALAVMTLPKTRASKKFGKA